jgi:hypothetical protein
VSASTGRVLVSFDIDGTMEFGDPPGPVSPEIVRALIERGCILGCASDREVSSQAALWRRHDIELSFIGGKHNLPTVKTTFNADRYIHIGDTDLDKRYAIQAGFEFISVFDKIDLISLA